MKKITLIALLVLMTSSFGKKNDQIEELKKTPVKRASGEVIKFEEIEIFSCKNIPNNRYLFNKKQTDVCVVGSSSDESSISSKLGGSYVGNDMVILDKCPSQWLNVDYCSSKKLRKF